jgi:hypothetical protein
VLISKGIDKHRVSIFFQSCSWGSINLIWFSGQLVLFGSHKKTKFKNGRERYWWKIKRGLGGFFYWQNWESRHLVFLITFVLTWTFSLQLESGRWNLILSFMEALANTLILLYLATSRTDLWPKTLLTMNISALGSSFSTNINNI